MPHIFISYARADGRDYAEKLEADLQAAGFTTWRDLRDIDEYQDFSVEIELAIREADFVVTCITPSVETSPRSFVRREIIYADNKSKPIIPCIFPNATPITLINHLTWIAFHKGKQSSQTLDYESGLKLLLDRLHKPHKADPLRPTDDPYAEYLKALYEQIVEYLQQTVFALNSALIELRAESSPDAVHTIQQQALPLAFFGQAGINSPQNEHKQFASFHDAFDFYGGRILLLGDPGAGKTTTLLAFIRDAVWRRLEGPTLPLPIIAPISTWDVRKQPPLIDWIAELIPLLKRDDLVQLVSNGKALLALDGLDELGSEHEGVDPRKQFMSLLPANNQVILSCRVKDYAEIGQKAPLAGAITLHPLDDVQMQSYLSNQPDLWAAVQMDDGLRDIARTPLLLSLFAYAFNGLDNEAKALHSLARGDLRDKIFETYVRRRYEHETRKRPLKPLEEMIAVLQYGAFHGIANVNKLIDVRGGQITHDWESPDDIEMGDFVNPAGIDNTLDAPFIAAEFGRRMRATQMLLDQARLLHILLPVGKRHYRFIHLLLRDHFAFTLATSALREPDEAIRHKAVDVLGRIGDQRALEGLIETLHDPTPHVRKRAVIALGLIGKRWGSDHVIDSLIATLDDQDKYVLQEVVKTLKGLQNPTAVPPLIELLRARDRDRQARRLAEQALVAFGTPEALVAVESWRWERGQS